MGASRGIKQIHHPYLRWECFKNGMWRNASKEEVERLLPIAYDFTKNHLQYGRSMKKVVEKWRYSCENFLSDVHINRKAWLGHAACSLELDLPEVIVRKAWGMLTDSQRNLANKEAEKYINYWENLHLSKNQVNQLHIFNEEQNRKIYLKMGKTMLQNRDTG